MFTLGQKVKFADKQGRILVATIINISAKTCTVVVDGSGQKWRVNPVLLAPLNSTSVPTLTTSDGKFKKGDRVEWKGRVGTIVRVNDKTYSIDFDDGSKGRISGLSLKASSIPLSADAKKNTTMAEAFRQMNRVSKKFTLPNGEIDDNALEAYFS